MKSSATTIIAVHSFRRSVGRSTLTANLGAMLAAEGARVGMVDVDFAAPSLHLFFRLSDNELSPTLNDFLLQRSSIQEACHDLSYRLPPRKDQRPPGKLWLVPASTRASDIVYMLRNPLNFETFNQGLQMLEDSLEPDYLLLDLAAGLNKETMSVLAQAQILLILLRPDQQDYQGTAVIVEVARHLEMGRILIALNEIPDTYNYEQARRQLQKTYRPDFAAVLPRHPTLQAIGEPLIWRQPDDPFIEFFNQIAAYIRHVNGMIAA